MKRWKGRTSEKQKGQAAYLERHKQEILKKRQENDPMGRDSDSCVNINTKEPIREYNSKHDAQDGANFHNSKTSGYKVMPYQCDTCGLWHWSFKGKQNPSSKVVTGTEQHKRRIEIAKGTDSSGSTASLKLSALEIFRELSKSKNKIRGTRIQRTGGCQMCDANPDILWRYHLATTNYMNLCFLCKTKLFKRRNQNKPDFVIIVSGGGVGVGGRSN